MAKFDSYQKNQIMEKRILLPTDFSRNALNAARMAMDLFAGTKCDFYLLHVFQVSGYSIDSLMVPAPGEAKYEAARAEADINLKKLLEILKLHGKNPEHTFHKLSSYNSLVYGIKAVIAKQDIDLIVMGTRGATDIQSIIFGTNTVHVMEEITECPVLAVPEDYPYKPPREIVFPTDFKVAYKRRELNYLLEIAKEHGSVIRVLHIKDETELSREQKINKELLESILQGYNHEFHVLEDLKVHKGIGAFVASRNSDLIVFMNRKHSYLAKVFSEPLVKELGYHYQIPILELNATS